VPSLREIKLVYKPLVFSVSLIPAATLVLALNEVGSFRLGPNPIESIQDTLGIWGIRFLLITLAITPLRRLTGQVWLLRFRRMFGLFAFVYCCLHFLNYLILDQSINVPAIFEDITKRPFITVGFAAILCMMPLAITSTSGWRRQLGTNWQKLHYLVYVIAMLACWHFYWQVKKDITEPLTYICIVTILFGIRAAHRLRRSKKAGANPSEPLSDAARQ